jgi:hypothetical protein
MAKTTGITLRGGERHVFAGVTRAGGASPSPTGNGKGWSEKLGREPQRDYGA